VGHNSERWLRGCLTSVTANAPPDALFVYVDNASTDSSCEIVEEHQSVMCVSEDVNRGFGTACNRGAEVTISAGADCLFFLNPDTTADWRAIAYCAAMVDARSDVAVVGPLQLEFSTGAEAPDYNSWTRRAVRSARSDVLANHRLDPLSSSRFNEWLADAPEFVETWYVNGGALCVRADRFMELGGFDERYFLFFEEVALCREAWAHGYRVGLCTGASIQHAWGGHASGPRGRIWARSKYLYLLSDPHAGPRTRLMNWVGELVRDLGRGPEGWRHGLIGFQSMAESLSASNGSARRPEWIDG
jgi:N-acetylglucosaminyl-diphospho-decaprenol L-rhamnosyltransferase